MQIAHSWILLLCKKNQSDSLLLIGLINPFTFNVMVDITGFATVFSMAHVYFSSSVSPLLPLLTLSKQFLDQHCNSFK